MLDKLERQGNKRTRTSTNGRFAAAGIGATPKADNKENTNSLNRDADIAPPAKKRSGSLSSVVSVELASDVPTSTPSVPAATSSSAVTMSSISETLSLIASAHPGAREQSKQETKKLKQMTRQLEEAKAQMESQQKEYEAKIAALQATNLSLQRQVSNAQQEKDDLRSQIKTVETQLNQSTTAEQANALRIEQLQKERATLSSKLEAEIAAKVVEKEKALKLVVNHGTEISILRDVLEHRISSEREEKIGLQKKLQDNEQEQERLLANLVELEAQLARAQETQKADQQLATLNTVKDAFELQLKQYKKTNKRLTDHLNNVEQQLFFSLTLAIKLSRSLAGEFCNQDTNELFSEALARKLEVKDWSAWLNRKLRQSDE